MQRSVDVEINVAPFVPEVACGTVLARVQMRKSRKIQVLCQRPACCRLGVHGGLPIEMGWRIHPEETKVAFYLGASPDVWW